MCDQELVLTGSQRKSKYAEEADHYGTTPTVQDSVIFWFLFIFHIEMWIRKIKLILIHITLFVFCGLFVLLHPSLTSFCQSIFHTHSPMHFPIHCLSICLLHNSHTHTRARTYTHTHTHTCVHTHTHRCTIFTSLSWHTQSSKPFLQVLMLTVKHIYMQRHSK